MVRVVDAIMGTGKSSASITYMNEHPEKKFIYITPYLDEAKRIAAGCPIMQFYEPQKLSQHNGSKTLHTIDLVMRGENVATTHQAFRMYPMELLDMIREKEYTLIIDENVDLLEDTEEDQGDIQMFIDAGYVAESENNKGVYKLVKDTYYGKAHAELMRTLRTRDLIKISNTQKESFYYWQLPPELITAAKDVYILTYLFKGQSMHHFLEMYKIPYQFAYITRDKNGAFRFSDTERYVPEYVKTLGDKIHILEHDKLNAIGDTPTALSVSWFKKPTSDVTKLKNNIYNFFFNIHPTTSDKKMWSTFKSAKQQLRGKGYTNGFIPFNQRAVNTYKGRNVAAYCVNIYMDVGQKLFYLDNGVDVNDDDYALSAMVQWIWRSAIRDGEEIWLYIPSSRMRTLLKNWIEEVSM